MEFYYRLSLAEFLVVIKASSPSLCCLAFIFRSVELLSRERFSLVKRWTLFTIHERAATRWFKLRSVSPRKKSHTVLDFLWLLKENSRKMAFIWEISHRHLLSSWGCIFITLKVNECQESSSRDLFQLTRDVGNRFIWTMHRKEEIWEKRKTTRRMINLITKSRVISIATSCFYLGGEVTEICFHRTQVDVVVVSSGFRQATVIVKTAKPKKSSHTKNERSLAPSNNHNNHSQEPKLSAMMNQQFFSPRSSLIVRSASFRWRIKKNIN